MGKRILIISLVLVVIFSVAACTKEPSVQEIVDGVIESMNNTKTYQFDMDITMDMAGEAEGEEFEATMVVAYSGTLDLDNIQMKMDMTMNMATPGEDEVEEEMKVYLVGDMMYLFTDIPEIGPTWVKSEMTEEIWEEMKSGMTDLLDYQFEFLETSQVKVIGSERVRGIDCYVIQIIPDMELLWQSVSQQAEITGGGMPAVAEDILQEMFDSYTIKQWVAKDTYFMTKVEMDIAMELTPEAMGLPEEEGIITMNMTVNGLVYNYNQPVSIVLPQEAEEAEEAVTPPEIIANSEAAIVKTAAAAYYAEYGVRPDDSTVLNTYLTTTPSCIYSFDKTGLIDGVSDQSGITAGLTFNVDTQMWEE